MVRRFTKALATLDLEFSDVGIGDRIRWTLMERELANGL